MTKRERILRFAAQALGGATLIGLWIEYMSVSPNPKMTLLFILSAALFLLLTLLAMKLLRIRCFPALGSMAICYVSGVVMAMAMAALILLLAEMNTAFGSMLLLIRHGGQ